MDIVLYLLSFQTFSSSYQVSITFIVSEWHSKVLLPRYNIPEDLFPYKDELGEWHPPRISGRYAADVMNL